MALGRPSFIALTICLLAAWPLTSLAASAGITHCGSLIANGCEAWVAHHKGEYAADAQPIASPDGSVVYIASHTIPVGGAVVVVTAYDAVTGSLIWNTTYGPATSPELHMAAVTPDGSRLHVIGSSPAVATLWEAFIATFDTRDGSLLWEERWDIPSHGRAVAVSPDSERVYLTGSYRKDLITIAFDSATGTPVWTHRYNNAGGDTGDWRRSSFDEGEGVSATEEGVYVTGMSANQNGILEAVTIALDVHNGSQRWVSRTGTTAGIPSAPAHAEAFEVVASPNAVYTLGSHGLVAYDPQTGQPLWSSTTATCRAYFSYWNHGECVLELHLETSRLFAHVNKDLVAYNATTGEKVWHLPMRIDDGYPTTAKNQAGDMTISADGTRLYLATGDGYDRFVTDSNGDRFETIALDTKDGLPLWRTVYDRGLEHLSGIAVSPDGERVFVTGTVVTTGRAQVLTLAYTTDLGFAHGSKLI